MLTGQLRNDIDGLWEKFWTGGVTNPLVVIEQISYLMFSRMLDMQETTAEKKAKRTGKPFTRQFPETPEGQLLRWQNFKNMSGAELLPHLRNNVFPHFSDIELNGSDIAQFMADADVEIRSESVLLSAVEMVDQLPLEQSDVKGDIYEYLLSKLSSAGINGQFRTPRHIIDMMVEMLDVQPTDVICDPACGTAGFLSRAMEYLTRTHTSPESIYQDEDGNNVYTGDMLHEYQDHINNKMFWGFDFDTTMLRVSAMNMLLHGVSSANITYQDSLNKNFAGKAQEENFFDKILANPPFKGSLDEQSVNPQVLSMVKTKKTELLFVALILRMLKLGGRSATIVPDGVLFGSSKAHKDLRQELIDNNQLEAMISLPSGVFKPYAGVSTGILIFTKGGSTDKVMFYDMQADGYSLDDKRNPIKDNDIPEALAKWKRYSELYQANDTAALIAEFGDKTQKAFMVSAEDIKAQKYDLSINRYKEVVYEEEVYEDPKVILGKLKTLENEILADLNELEGML
ncbi:type I restriction enzyme M protein [Vibrio crassostreae]|uniref:type I restriction-modification system subunit M n=1 Tax=Vibrio crassostreae TaxID=246167 RepID=UPI000F4A7B10|nr:class I SAM-dependent DNA methyltransferase [Vibrio crassostreae]ROR70206.1 type I restriction enzyme M protein [Vibrio crassostreae]